MGRKTLTRKIRKARKTKAKVIKRKNNDTIQQQQQQQPLQRFGQPPMNMAMNQSARLALMQRMAGGTTPSFITGRTSSSTERMVNQTNQLDAENKRGFTDAEVIKKAFDETKKENIKMKKKVKEGAKLIENQKKMLEENEKYKEQVEKQFDEHRNITKKLMKTQIAVDVDALKDKTAEMKANIEELEERDIELQGIHEKNELGRENESLGRKYAMLQAKTAAVDDLLKSNDYSNSIEAHKEHVKNILKAEAEYDFKKQLLQQQQEAAITKLKLDSAVTPEEYAAFEKQYQQELKNTNTQIFAAKNKQFHLQKAENKYNARMKAAMDADVELSELNNNNEALGAMQTALSNAQTEISATTKNTLAASALKKRQIYEKEREIKMREELQKSKEKEVAQNAEIAAMNDNNVLATQKIINDLEVKTAVTEQRTKRLQLQKQSREQLASAEIQNNVANAVASSPYSQSQTLHLQARAIANQFEGQNKLLNDKAEIWGKVQELINRPDAGITSWDAFKDSVGMREFNERDAMSYDIESLRNVYNNYKQYLLFYTLKSSPVNNVDDADSNDFLA